MTVLSEKSVNHQSCRNYNTTKLQFIPRGLKCEISWQSILYLIDRRYATQSHNFVIMDGMILLLFICESEHSVETE